MAPELPLSTYQFKFETLDAVEMPPYPGILWHSVFGLALRNLVCINRNAECASCMFLHQCDYTHLFQGTRPPDSDIMRKYTTVPTPHVFRMTTLEAETLPPGAALTIEVVLPGNSNQKLPVLVRALYGAGQQGLGKQRSRALLKQVIQTNPDGLHHDLLRDGHLQEAMPPLPVGIPNAPATVELQLLTPYKPSGQAGRNGDIDIGRYLMAIIRRIDLMQYFYTGHKLEADFQHLKALTESVPVLEKVLSFQPSARYSAAGQRSKDTSGFTGQVTLDLREHQALWPFLWAGQWLGVGKNASMGFGRYALRVL